MKVHIATQTHNIDTHLISRFKSINAGILIPPKTSNFCLSDHTQYMKDHLNNQSRPLSTHVIDGLCEILLHISITFAASLIHQSVHP